MKRVFEESDIHEGLDEFWRFLSKDERETLVNAVRKARLRRVREALDQKEEAALSEVNARMSWTNERQRAAFKKAERALKRIWNEQTRASAEFAELYGLKG